MPDLEKARRHRKKVTLDEIIEHGQEVGRGKRIPTDWRKVWARFEPQNLAQAETETGPFSGSGHQGREAFADFVVRFSARFQVNQWICYKGTVYQIEAIENVDRSRWQVLSCQKYAYQQP